MVDGDTFNNLIPIIVSSLFTFGGLLKANIINEVVYFGGEWCNNVPSVENECYC
jgi:hypothetical protein